MVQREDFSFADLEQWLNERRVTEIECLVPDLTGVARGKILPRERFTEDRGMRLPEVVVAMGVTGEFPDEGPYYDVISPTDHDMHLRPDPGTVRIVPWAADPTAQVIHDCYDRHGQLVPYAPRSVLRRVCELYRAEGWSPVVAPELEFYLLERNTDPDVPLKPPVGRSGRAETSRQSYSIDAVNEFDPLFEDIYEYCEKMELNVDTLIHEAGAGQMEINFFHGDPLGLADEVFLFKRTVREAALRHDMFATFMAKPIAGEPGSAMHIHQSVVGTADGRNIFSNADGSASQEFLWYIGGLQRYIPAAMALFAPYVNSYRRLARYSSAPINIQWGVDNRTVGIRSPVAPPQARRVENRVIGADANPYVALAATLACGWLGIKKRIEPSAECTGDAYLGKHQLTHSLGEALQLLREEADLAAVLGKGFITVYSEIKEIEHDEFMKVISPWEREHLLLHV
ncbi:MAG TPA: glutamine synthetase family protein [Rubrivivax sp.]|nr:glutamine synthetase [Pseudomonadota bacterium]MCW5638568.1 glutamine synthetase [Rubrivivax sp.]HOW47835.1 glutamine synthetase family protein [Rubrivivax sp.]HRY86967.1 glutamine synthetase family protein [Rubrivivax sp.]HRZ60899.1 glutamine synthetase family protein [Rubrivivax sp.]